MAVSAATEKPTKGLYKPSDEQLKNQARDKEHIDRALEYRRRFEPQWTISAQKWNIVAPQGLEGTPNYVVPITRMATHTGIVSMRQSLPQILPVPEGRDEKKLAYLLSQASEHVHRMSNMEAVMDQAIVDFAVLGNMVLESYVKVPYIARRIPVLDKNKQPIPGKYKTIHKRDWSRPKIGTRSRSPWDCAFDPGAKTPSDIRFCTFQDRISFAEFEEQYLNNPHSDYINTNLVEAGWVWVMQDNSTMERVSTSHKKVVVDHYQNELEDCYRIYANGILIWDVPLSSVHCHGKCTLSLIPNHHKYDDNLKTHALYGVGDPELLSEMDDLIQAITNMFVLNYRNKNTYVVGIEGAGDVSEIDFTSGDPVSGKVSIQSLGAADLPEWQSFKENLEEWAVQIVKKNYRRLEGDVAKTATEIIQKRQSENQGMEYQIKRMESGGFLEYVRKHVSDIMEHLPVEEWEDITDGDASSIKELLKAKEIANEDVVFGKRRTPVKVRYIERIRTKGRVFKEHFEKGKRSLDNLQEVSEMAGQDGWLPASNEYLHTRSWRLFKRVPDCYLIGKTMLGQDDMTQLSKIEQLLGIVERTVNLRSAGARKLTQVSMDSVEEKAIDAIGLRKEELQGGEPDEEEEQIDEAIEAIQSILQPDPSTLSNEAQSVQAAVPGQTPDLAGRAARPNEPQGNSLAIA